MVITEYTRGSNMINIEKSNNNIPCVWENGGGYSNTGRAIIVAGLYGEKLKPLYVRKKGQLACSDHALIEVRIGYMIIEAEHGRGDFDISIYAVVDPENGIVKIIHSYTMGSWDRKPPLYLKSAIDAAKRKALFYHCREPLYIA